ncbi:hypothetical protein GLOTRDRAFT_44745, partial [Gloeophyllum trabeum ATCC 11539]
RDGWFLKFGARWTEFARLSYFDLVWFTLIDPMHNVLLGLAKNQWYTRWIQTKALRAPTPKSECEIGMLHQFLETVESPLWAGRLPMRMGEPAGGSLTADEYKFATTGALPIIVSPHYLTQMTNSINGFQIPIIWDVYLEGSVAALGAGKEHYEAELEQYKKDHKLWQAREARRQKKSQDEGKTDSKKTSNKDPEPTLPRAPSPCGGARSISEVCDVPQDIAWMLYGEGTMKPNHCWVVHQPDQIRDYGPVYGFWLFLTERLNKTLKSYHTNHHTRGQMEITLMCSFGCEKCARALVRHLNADLILVSFYKVAMLAKQPANHAECEVLSRMLAWDGEECGTIQAAAIGSTPIPDLERATLNDGLWSLSRNTL